MTIVGGVPYRVGRVESLGVRQDVPQLLASSHVFVYTPQPNEGTLDLVILEAMASGLPCVLSNVPAVRWGDGWQLVRGELVSDIAALRLVHSIANLPTCGEVAPPGNVGN